MTPVEEPGRTRGSGWDPYKQHDKDPPHFHQSKTPRATHLSLNEHPQNYS